MAPKLTVSEASEDFERAVSATGALSELVCLSKRASLAEWPKKDAREKSGNERVSGRQSLPSPQREKQFANKHTSALYKTSHLC